MSDPRQERVTVNGVSICYFEWGERAAGAGSALLVHATGFHGRCWDRCAAHLSGHVIALDLRGHGRSDKVGPYTWDVFGNDVANFVEALDLRDIVAGGHSMGGHSIVQAAAAVPERFRRLVLVDPVIMAPEVYGTWGNAMGLASAADHPTAKRRNNWDSPQQMFDRFKDRSPFATWRPEVLRDYCQWGLLPAPNAEHGYVLACPPLVEASIYMGNSGRDVYGIIDAVAMPVTVMRGRERDSERAGPMDFSGSPTWPGLAGRFAQGRDVYLPNLSHFIAMEDPELVADYVAGRR